MHAIDNNRVEGQQTWISHGSVEGESTKKTIDRDVSISKAVCMATQEGRQCWEQQRLVFFVRMSTLVRRNQHVDGINSRLFKSNYPASFSMLLSAERKFCFVDV